MTALLPIHLLLSRPGPLSVNTPAIIHSYHMELCKLSRVGRTSTLREGEEAFKDVTEQFTKTEKKRKYMLSTCILF